MADKRICTLLSLLIALLLAPIGFAQDESATASDSSESDTDWSEFESTIGSEDLTLSTGSIFDVEGTIHKSYPFRRLIMREDITIRIKKLKLESGKKVTLVYGTPRNVKNVPAVFIIDVETSSIANHYSLIHPGLSKKNRDELNYAAYLLRSPFGSNFLGNGFAVAYIVPEDLDSLRTARTKDWLEAFERIRNLKEVDEESFFLFSTREYANLSVYLASQYSFSGFILEEPEYMLFSRKTYDSVIRRSDRLSTDEIWQRTDPTRADKYYSILSRITAPIMLIRNANSRASDFNDKTLIPKLVEANTYFETIEVSGAARSLTVFGGGRGVIEIEPEVSYYPSNVSLWLDEMITYMKVNSSTTPLALRDPASYKSWD